MEAQDEPNRTELPVEYLFEFNVDFGDGMLIYPSPAGMRIDAIISAGKVEGPRLRGVVLPGGGDWLTVTSDGVGRMDVRATIRTDTGDVVHYTSSGRTVLDDGTRGRFLAGETIYDSEVYGRSAPLFETASKTYDWLNGIAAVGLVRELSLEHIRYRILALK